MNLFDFTLDIWQFIIKAYRGFNRLWNSELDLVIFSVSFQELMTASIVVAVGFMLVKKFV